MLCRFCAKHLKNINIYSDIKMSCHNCLYFYLWKNDRIIKEFFYYKDMLSDPLIYVSHEYEFIQIKISDIKIYNLKYGNFKLNPKKSKEIIYNHIKYDIL